LERSIFHGHPTLRRSVGQARRERLEGDVIKAGTAWDSQWDGNNVGGSKFTDTFQRIVNGILMGF
jgi:hypothetical protein